MIQRDGVLGFTQPGWLYGIAFFVIAAVIAAVLYQDNVKFSGAGIIGYLAVGIFVLIGILYTLYIHRVYFDTDGRRFMVEKGFIGFIKQSEAGFDDITLVKIREVKSASRQHDGNQTLMTMTIDIGIECKTNEPVFDLWRAESKEKAMYVAGTLATIFGCEVKYDSR